MKPRWRPTVGLLAAWAMAATARAACPNGTALMACHPEPVYAAPGDLQTWRLSFSQDGGSSAWNLTITTQSDFTGRLYAGPSFSATVTGGANVTPSFATALAGPWTDGEPGGAATRHVARADGLGVVCSLT